MKQTLLAGLVLWGSAFGAQAATMNVYASPAPNFGFSGSFDGWAANALYALEHGLSSAGSFGTSPTAYYQTTTATAESNLITSTFNSWQGVAGPAGAFASEFGNKLHFVLVADGGDTQISLSMLSVVVDSNDIYNLYDSTTDFSGANYNQYRVGVINGVGGPTYITSGAGTQLVDRLLYVGVGTALFADHPSLGCTGGTNQQTMDCAAGLMNTIIPFSVTATYSLNFAPSDVLPDSLVTGSATVNFVTPEPGTWALLLTGVGGILLARKRSTVR